MKMHLYVFDNEGETKHLGLVTVNSDRYVVETDTPIEDYGNYLLSADPIEKPYKRWLSALKE